MKSKYHHLLFWLALGVLLPEITAAALTTDYQKQVDKLQESVLATMKTRLLTRGADYGQAGQGETLTELESLAVERKKNIMELLERDRADLVIKHLITAGEKQILSPRLQSELEDEITVEGEIEHLIFDNFAKQTAKKYLSLKSADGVSSYTLKSLPGGALFTDGARVRVKGFRFNDTLLLGDKDSDQQILSAKGGPIGEIMRVAVVLINFEDDKSQPFTVEAARQAVFEGIPSVNSYFRDVSHGRLRLEGLTNGERGDVFGWLTIPQRQADCSSTPTTNALWERSAQAVLNRLKINLDLYDKIIFIFPKTTNDDCKNFGGWATIGGKTAFVNGTMNVQTIAHELGHTLGLHHANALTCYPVDQSVIDPLLSSFRRDVCLLEYGDGLGIMGRPGNTYHLNNFQKLQLGWLGEAEVLTVTDSGTYTLRPLNASGQSGKKAIKVLWSIRGTNRVPDRYYYLEYRQPYGFYDFFGPSSSVVTGVTIRLAPAADRAEDSWLIDSSPGTQSPGDASLGVGKIFKDDSTGIQIKVVALQPDAATVTITIDDAPPQVEITSPRSGARISSSTIVRVKATDNVRINSLTLLIDGQVREITDFVGGEFIFDAKNLSPGPHTITVEAIDPMGNKGRDQVTVTVVSGPPPDLVGPAITFLSPVANGYVLPRSGSIRLGASALDVSGVAKITIGLSGQPLVTCDNFTFHNAIIQNCSRRVPVSQLTPGTLIAFTATDRSPAANANAKFVIVQQGKLLQTNDPNANAPSNKSGPAKEQSGPTIQFLPPLVGGYRLPASGLVTISVRVSDVVGLRRTDIYVNNGLIQSCVNPATPTTDICEVTLPVSLLSAGSVILVSAISHTPAATINYEGLKVNP